jgi:hypothetical protein
MPTTPSIYIGEVFAPLAQLFDHGSGFFVPSGRAEVAQAVCLAVAQAFALKLQTVLQATDTMEQSLLRIKRNRKRAADDGPGDTDKIREQLRLDAEALCAAVRALGPCPGKSPMLPIMSVWGFGRQVLERGAAEAADLLRATLASIAQAHAGGLLDAGDSTAALVSNDTGLTEDQDVDAGSRGSGSGGVEAELEE